MLTFFIVLVLGLTGFSHGAAIQDPSENVGIELQVPRGQTREEYLQSIIDYWTPERMASAIPLTPTIDDETALRYLKNYEKTERSAAVLVSSALLSGMETTKPQVAGKVYFNVGTSRYVCSGSAVNAANQDTVVTAGHCVFDYERQVWATNWIFVPHYSLGNRPLGSFTSRKLATKSGWMNSRDFNHDVGIAVMNRNERGQHVQEVAGGLGITLDAPRNGRVTSFGYPVNINSGEVVSNCASNPLSPNFIVGFSGLQLASCPMTGGCSGGPWVQEYNVGTPSGQQVSVNSFIMTNRPQNLFGPYFTENNIGSLYRENQAL